MAISVGGRAIFSAIPSVQPSSYIIIITALLYGSEMGFIAGILTAVLSNLLLGFGPFVIYQMLGWGLMGFFAGFLKNRNFIIIAVYGFVWGFFYGWITNFWYILSVRAVPLNWTSIIAGAAFSFNLDLAHAICNFALLMVLPVNIIRKLKKN